jgi:lipopolysaccharide export system permease protein
MMTPNFTQNAQFKLDRYQVSIGSLLRSGPEGLSLTDVLLFTRPQPNTIEIIQAKSGTYDHGLWKLKDTTFRLITGDDMVQFRKGEEITINEKIGLSDLFVPPPVEQLSIGQLLQSIELAKKEGRSSREMEIQLNGRFSVPAACLMFGCVAPILAIPFARSGGFAGVLLSVFLVFLYYNSYIICTEIIGRNGWLNPFVSSWLTNILFIFLGVLALRRME